MAAHVAADLIGSPVLRAGQVARRLDVTPQAAMNALRRLAELGILEERTRNGRVSFTAGEVVELIGR